MKTKQPEIIDTLEHNLAILNSFWNRTTFHDMSIHEMNRLNGNVIFRMREFVLVFRGVTQFAKSDDFDDDEGDCWMYHKLDQHPHQASIEIETQCGRIYITFKNFRLFDASDFSILIPDLDGRLRLVN